MATLAQFLKTGSLGPIVLGMDPSEIIDQVGEPEQISQKTNPLTLKYGSLQLVFWKQGPRSQLRDITLTFLPAFEPLPDSLALEDFRPTGRPTERDLRNFIHEIRYLPAHMTEQESGRELVFLSGIAVDFEDGLLNRIRISQKTTKETAEGTLSDIREPSRDQILEMIQESERALQFGSRRAALLMAWAALEASLRRTALRMGRHGHIGVQPTILIRELISAKLLSPKMARSVEEVRQLRNVSVHGLAPVEIQEQAISEMTDICRQLLADTGNRRRQRDVADIFAIEAIEAYSIIVSEQMVQPLWHFFESKGLRGRIVRNAITGDNPQHDIQIEKTISFREFNRLVNEWKERYINSDSSIPTP